MTTSENFIYNVYGDKQNEPQITTKIQSLSKDDYDIYFCELGKELWAPFGEPNDWFKQVLLSIWLIQGISWKMHP